MLNELFSEHGIPETLRSDNGPQFANHIFAEFTKEWNFDHNSSSPRNPRSNGQAEVTVKTVKGLITKAKYSEQTRVLPYWPREVHPLIPTYDHQLRCSIGETSVQYSHKGSATRTPTLQMTMTDSVNVLPRVLSTMTIMQTQVPLYAGQTVSVLNNDKSLWLPAKVICKADHGSYLVQVIGGGQYRHACDHICECHLDAVKPGTSTTADVAPATPESLLQVSSAKPPAVPAAPVAPATPQQAAPAAATNTPCKPPTAVRTPQ